MTTLVVIAKACVPGHVKTRLHPPLTLDDAAQVASASLADTLEALGGTTAGAGTTAVEGTGMAAAVERRVLFFDGGPDDVPPEAVGYDLVQQPGGSLDERIGWLLDHVAGPLLLVGMDTPQVTAAHLAPALAGLAALPGTSTADAWLGPASDGGLWALGLGAWPAGASGRRGDLVRGVPMSRDDTGARQRERLERAGLRVRLLEELTDVDTVADLATVAGRAPDGRFATVVRELSVAVPS